MTILEALQLLREDEEITLRRRRDNVLSVSFRDENYAKEFNFVKGSFDLMSLNLADAMVESLVFDCLNAVREKEEENGHAD